MFFWMRRVWTGLPLLSVLIGLVGQPTLLVLPPALTALYVLHRDRLIRRRVGLAAWPSDGFARHVLVDDLGWLVCLTFAGLPLFAIGMAARQVLIGA